MSQFNAPRTTKEAFELRMRYLDASRALLGDICTIYAKMALNQEIEPALYQSFLYHIQNHRQSLQQAELDIIRAFSVQQYVSHLPAVSQSTPDWHERQTTQPLPRVGQVTQPLRNTSGRLRTVRLKPPFPEDK